MTDNSVINLKANISELLQNAEYLSGETPENIKERCLELCQKYLAGVWIKQKPNNIEVSQLTGGYSNQIYLCQITDCNKEPTNEPKEVVIRLYGYSIALNMFEDNKR